MISRLTVRTPIAPLLGEPRISHALTSQLPMGSVQQLLEERGDWVRVRGADGYEGWTHRGYLAPTTGSEATWRLSLGCTVRDAHGVRHTVPLGARVAPSAEILAGESLDASEQRARFPHDAAAIVTTALTHFEGASYLWGGVTPWGCDCSGFVQSVFALHGVSLPRDAWQQAELGHAISQRVDALLPAAALLFFSDREDRRITHVGIATGDGRMVHSGLARGGVAIETMSAGDAYTARLRAQAIVVRAVL